MKHHRYLIHAEYSSISDYGDNTRYVQEVAELIATRCRLSAGWTIDSVMNEAFYQARTLLFDFSPKIFFEVEYYNEAVKRMPLNVANAVFSVVYILLNSTECMSDVLKMIEYKLSNKPIFNYARNLKVNSKEICLYPNTEYFANSDFVNWRLFTENFRPDCVWRILFISQSYEFHNVVARGILGQLESYMKEIGKPNDENLNNSKDMLVSCVDQALAWSLYIGDSATQDDAYGFPMAIIEKDSQETLSKLKQTENILESYKNKCEEMKSQIAKAEEAKEKQFRESEEYKKSIEDMKHRLGKSHIPLKTIADCILRLPTFDLQYHTFQQINALLTGTEWSEKAEEVLSKMFGKVREQSQNTSINIENFNNNGTYNDNSISVHETDVPRLNE